MIGGKLLICALKEGLRKGEPAGLAALLPQLDHTPLTIDDERRICFVRDPDGNVIEFDEPLAG